MWLSIYISDKLPGDVYVARVGTLVYGASRALLPKFRRLLSSEWAGGGGREPEVLIEIKIPGSHLKSTQLEPVKQVP